MSGEATAGRGPDSRLVHATCIRLGEHGILLTGAPGCGKSDLALRLIDRGAKLVSDDYTFVRRTEGRLLASAPDTISAARNVSHVQ